MSKTLTDTTEGRRLVETTVLKSRETSRRNAKSMSGYKIEAVDAPDGKFFLWRPRSLPPLYDEQNNLVHGYHIDILNGECQCWVWCRTRKEFGIGECKHLLYTRKEVERSLRMLGLWTSSRTLDDACETYANEKIYPLEGRN